MDVLKKYGLFGLAALAILAGAATSTAGYDLIGYLSGALLFAAGITNLSARRGILASSVVAWAANAYLFSRKLDASGRSVCNINEVLNCDVVNQSTASEMLGIPITLFGMAFYLGLAFAAMVNPKSAPKLFQVNTLFAIISLIYSAYLAYQSKLIGAVCVMCVSIYVANALLLWAGIKGMRETGARLIGDVAKLVTSRSMLTVIGTFVVITIIGQWMIPARPDPVRPPANVDPNSPAFLARLFSRPGGEVRLDGSEHILGNPIAPYVLVEWADYACPHCASAGRDVKQLVEEEPSIQVHFKNFPLTAACNPGISHDSGPDRCRAAMAAECAGEQSNGLFWATQELLFANQPRFSGKDLHTMAEQAGVDIVLWEECMRNQAVIAGVVADAKAGIEAGVRGTPAMYLKGVHGEGYVEVFGAGAALRLVEAHKAGVALPEPGPSRAN